MKQHARFLMILTLVIVIGIFSWFVWTNGSAVGSVNPDSPGAQNVTVVSLESAADGRIQYGYGIQLPPASAHTPADAAQLLAMVEYDTYTLEGINQYVTLNQSQVERLLKTASNDDSLAVQITFNRPLSQPEFMAFVEQYQMGVASYIIWIENEDDTITTIEGAPSESELIPTETFHYVLEDVQNRGGLGVPGWVEVDGLVPVGRLKQMQDDPQLFLIDVMTAVIQEQVTDATMKEAGIARAVRTAVLSQTLKVSRPMYLAWAIGNQGLMPGLPAR